jgi:hypothetical protein
LLRVIDLWRGALDYGPALYHGFLADLVAAIG